MGRGDSELALAQLFSRFTERMPKAVRLPFATDWRCDRSVTDPGQSLPALSKASLACAGLPARLALEATALRGALAFATGRPGPPSYSL